MQLYYWGRRSRFLTELIKWHWIPTQIFYHDFALCLRIRALKAHFQITKKKKKKKRS